MFWLRCQITGSGGWVKKVELRTNGVVLSLPGAKSKTMNEVLEAEKSQFGSAPMVVSAQRMDGPEGYQCFSEFWHHRKQDPVLTPETFL
jgi:hypothetical protein